MPDLSRRRLPRKELIVYFRGMQIFQRILFIVSCMLLFACLETPDSPAKIGNLFRLSVCLEKDSSCTIPLQVSPGDSFTVYAKTSPAEFENLLQFSWIKNEKVLHRGKFFATDTSQVPDSLIAIDDEGNRLSFSLDFTLDSPPKLSQKIIPENGDTLAGNSATAFFFSYSATDADKKDSLFYTLEWDSTFFYAGNLTQIYQSGFAPGNHTFRVYVQDRYGLRDSSEIIHFFVVEEL